MASLSAGGFRVGHRVTDAEIATVNLRSNALHGEWNRTIQPRRS